MESLLNGCEEGERIVCIDRVLTFHDGDIHAL